MTNCWECDKSKNELPVIRCEIDECSMVIHIDCYELIFGDVDDPGRINDILLCNDHFPHICGWCGAKGPAIPCDLCYEESIKQYICELCSFNREGKLSICRICDDSGSIISDTPASEDDDCSVNIDDDDDWDKTCSETCEILFNDQPKLNFSDSSSSINSYKYSVTSSDSSDGKDLK